MFKAKKIKVLFKDFFDIYKNRPIKNNKSGMRVEHCFALFCFLKKIKPSLVIESGVWKGQTTWLIRSTLPNTKIISIDTDLSQREIIYKNVKYLSKDITFYNWNRINKNKTVILFDDHVCFSKRINFILNENFRHIIFDDNLPNNFIGYYTPNILVNKQYLNKKIYIKYSNIYRMVKFFINYIFDLSKKNKITTTFRSTYVVISYKPNNIKVKKKLFSKFLKKLAFYYEFPPLLSLDLNIRFKKYIKNFNFSPYKYKYKVKKPIFSSKNSFDFNKEIGDEISIQYGNICYLKMNKK